MCCSLSWWRKPKSEGKFLCLCLCLLVFFLFRTINSSDNIYFEEIICVGTLLCCLKLISPGAICKFFPTWAVSSAWPLVSGLINFQFYVRRQPGGGRCYRHQWTINGGSRSRVCAALPWYRHSRVSTINGTDRNQLKPSPGSAAVKASVTLLPTSTHCMKNCSNRRTKVFGVTTQSRENWERIKSGSLAHLPKWTNFRKSFKRPLIPPLIFGKSHCRFLGTGWRLHVLIQFSTLVVEWEIFICQSPSFHWKQTSQSRED